MKKAKKVLALLLCAVLLVGASVMGTLAWLTDKTETVTNTFTAGEVDITLKESPYDPEDDSYAEPAEGTKNSYPAIPGAAYKKNPVVAVENDSEDSYLFVKFSYTTQADTYLNYTSNLTTGNGWTQVSTNTADGVTTEVWYRVVRKADATRSFDLLADLGDGYAADITLEIDSVAVTNQTKDTAAAQKLEWTAYAVQFNYLKDSDGAISGDTVDAAIKAWNILAANDPAVYPGTN